MLTLGAALAAGTFAHAGQTSWAAEQIRAVTQVGVLGTSPSTFAPTAPLTQAALADALTATAQLQQPPAPDPGPPAPPPLEIDSTLGNGAVVAGIVHWEIVVPNRDVDHVDFAVDGTGLTTAGFAPFVFDLGAGGLDTSTLADGPHTLAVKATFSGGGSAIAVWPITVANTPGSTLTGPTDPVAVPVVKESKAPATQPPPTAPGPPAVAYHATSPAKAVTIKQLDAAIVGYLGLGDAAREIQATLRSAGLTPPPNTGTEAVARMLGLRLNHPARQDSLEILPNRPATRAEAAWSFARTLQLDSAAADGVRQAAAAFTLPALTPWQQRILTTAVHYVGYPYVWGGTSPTAEVEFGVPSTGGFDCSGFVWRVYKLTSYAGEGSLAAVLRGRTTYVMSGEVPRSSLIDAAHLQPGDVMFFGPRGPKSKPSEVDHTALYLGNGWFIQSSDQGVTLLPFDGWHVGYFAWARRPLHEAGLE